MPLERGDYSKRGEAPDKPAGVDAKVRSGGYSSKARQTESADTWLAEVNREKVSLRGRHAAATSPSTTWRDLFEEASRRRQCQEERGQRHSRRPGGRYRHRRQASGKLEEGLPRDSSHQRMQRQSENSEGNQAGSGNPNAKQQALTGQPSGGLL